MQRRYSLSDHLIGHADNMLRTLFAPPSAARPSPATDVENQGLETWEQDEARRLMRVNHTGEVCAQALYQGQSLTARNPALRETFRKAAEEENDHLAWCEDRIRSLDGRTSRLNPLFYVGSYAIGAMAGVLGDRASAAFLAETEYQVADHLNRHLQKLPAADRKSHSVIRQMTEDELEHAKTAEQVGDLQLSEPAKGMMRLMSRVMTGTSYLV
ncbi:MAG: 2-polyprenyl-3-methyl-6-methoxy-1,4-benzoquinone monooxygenase [Acidiferrobacterales bacterium]|nr:2-polyprenyl-3-methyl-6-methoxy-1,4-benzoquinone monooxygenase [Acidiferrobacterales bacterium]